MTDRSRSLAALTAFALFAATGASAQGHPQTRQGFWIGFGLGYGSLGRSGCMRDGGCATLDRAGGPSGYVKLGATVAPNVLIGGETNGWTKDESGGTTTAGNASLTAYYYPQPASGLFLRGGIGVATYSEEGHDAASGFGFVFGVGYDLRVGANTSITPVANFNWGSVGDLPDFLATGVKQNTLQLAVGVTFH